MTPRRIEFAELPSRMAEYEARLSAALETAHDPDVVHALLLTLRRIRAWRRRQEWRIAETETTEASFGIWRREDVDRLADQRDRAEASVDRIAETRENERINRRRNP